MKVVLTLLVRDEKDIIKSHLDYHLSLGIDHIIVTDNLSVDGTQDILSQYEALPEITVLRETRDNYAQSEWVTHMAKFAQEQLAADWVIHSDCDEFYVPYGDLGLKGILRNYSQSIDAISVYRHDFVPIGNQVVHPLKEMIYRKRFSTNIFGNVLPPKVIHRNIPKVVIGQGNHEILFPSNLLTLDCNEIEIFHYPIRSWEQFKNKIVKGGSAYERNTELGVTVGSTWRYLYEQYKQGKLEEEYLKLMYDESRINTELSNGDLSIDTSLAMLI